MQHILVPTDFSENAYKALIYTTKLFGKNPCTIHILHSIEEQASRLTSRVDIGKSERVIDELYDEADRKCEAVKSRLIADTKGCGHTFDVISTAMSLPRAMNRICAQRDVDMVVMGTKGQTGAKEVILGSNTVNVLRRIKKIPVLVIPVETEFEPISRMAFATSFKQNYDPSDLDELIYLAKLHNSDVKIFHIYEDKQITDAQRDHLDQLLKLMEGVKCDVDWIDSDTEKTRAIADYIDEKNIDLLAIIYYKYNFIVQLFRESIVKKIGRNPTTPYLVIPAS
ncbi:MAG: universal stress protein [Bacteroidia bacterium]|nr:universal stress protein [Bacteroidia bacterium]NNF30844.1 universal stress protein [Flavobacteriaceae bacterium]MBT8275449.1 universal stress protein [Bacteroidia bacterium]NNJ82521.1 universal stress protein [Flavobacteriaceae bacterium]NNK54457.1 universal stress protein [Flavobacteriaceae bacterium]